MKKEVRLCDECKARVGVYNCDICMCDLCQEHLAGTNNVNVGGTRFGTLYFCVQCNRKFNKARKGKSAEGLQDFYDGSFQKKIFAEVKQYVQSKIIAGEI